ncbi:MAG: hypothetical protein QM731_18775 [Chitinophagaceae bacterium]
MKRLVLMLAVIMMGIGSTFANNEKEINEKVASSFKNDFANATDVKWEKGKQFVKVTFTQNLQVMFAYYSEEGSLIAVSRNLTTGQLPLNLLAGFKKNYNGYWVSDLFEMVNGTDTAYYLTLENADNTVVLRSDGTAGWEVFKKTKKEVL